MWNIHQFYAMWESTSTGKPWSRQAKKSAVKYMVIGTVTCNAFSKFHKTPKMFYYTISRQCETMSSSWAKTKDMIFNNRNNSGTKVFENILYLKIIVMSSI